MKIISSKQILKAKLRNYDAWYAFGVYQALSGSFDSISYQKLL